MEHAQINGINIAYELGGAGTPMVMIHGAQGDQTMFAGLAATFRPRFKVLTFDQRGSGLSDKPDMPYSVAMLADDTAALMDHVGFADAHIIGVSMGGMIAQALAAHYPDHVRSLVSIMSSTGGRRVGWAAPSTLRLMFGAPPRDRDQAAERAAVMFRHIGSRGFPFDEQFIRDRARRAYDRDPRAASGTGRQLGAIVKSGDRTAELARITAPTLVIHGDHDPMVHPSGGRATAAAIPNARLVTIEGMGHDLPVALYPRVVDLIAAHAEQADPAGAPAGA
jgi:pimeloyl-ACP methyl ester carboxylesterase